MGFQVYMKVLVCLTDTPIGTVVSTIDELDIYSAKQNGMDGEEVDSPKAGEISTDHAKVESIRHSGAIVLYTEL